MTEKRLRRRRSADRQTLTAGEFAQGTFPKRDNAIGEPILWADCLNTSFLKNISFELRQGEILGFAGLVGAGRTETARALFGADELDSGTISALASKSERLDSAPVRI